MERETSAARVRGSRAMMIMLLPMLLSALGGYADVVHTGADAAAHDELLPVLALHAAQHILVTRKMLQRHLKKGLAPRDQGFTRPKVLVLLPFRAHALAFVRALCALLPPFIEQVENKARFEREYSEEEGAAPMPASKPADYQHLFDGNNDDCFRCPLRLTRKAAKLYAPFYKSDLVIASPLGIRLATGADGESKRDIDWLSSIEVVLAGYAAQFGAIRRNSAQFGAIP